METLRSALREMPIIAILRGIKPEEVKEVAEVLITAGIRIIEIPLNSPKPYKSLANLAQFGGAQILSGAGTVLTVEEVKAVAETGVNLCISPNTNGAVIAAAKREKLMSLPGAATPTEAFVALNAGADGLKMFPGESMPPVVVKEAKTNKTVCITMADPSANLFLSVSGDAEVSQDRELIKKMWNVAAAAWFQSGPENNDIAVVTIKPRYAEYWEGPTTAIGKAWQLAAGAFGKTEPPAHIRA